MEHYCITLAQAKRLVELGFELKSELYWYEFPTEGGISVFFNFLPQWADDEITGRYPAYHVGELGKILRGNSDFVMTTPEGKWLAYYSKPHLGMWEQICETEAQARGALLIYLLESKLL